MENRPGPEENEDRLKGGQGFAQGYSAERVWRTGMQVHVKGSKASVKRGLTESGSGVGAL